MKYRYDHHAIRFDAVVNAIRKSGRQGLSHITKHHRIALRMVRDSIEDLLHFGHEFAAQSRPLLFVLSRRFVELGLSDRAENQG